nr:unnamed protein product [Spirometra erinaceieuropaei]
MFGKSRPSLAPFEAQASEKLALYVYEYLVYSGAQKAAQTFLQEIQWEKNILLTDRPGFLFSWWSVFWDLYCAAPERREVWKHSNEARAFYDYVSSLLFKTARFLSCSSFCGAAYSAFCEAQLHLCPLI